MSREVEYTTVSACKFQLGDIHAFTDAGWRLEGGGGVDEAGDGSCADVTKMSCLYSAEGSSIRIRPMDRIRRDVPRWKEAEHFHVDVRLPTLFPDADGGGGVVGGDNGDISSNISSNGVTVLFQAKARECVAVALGPRTRFVVGGTYEVIFGDRGNTATTIRKGGAGRNKNKKNRRNRGNNNSGRGDGGENGSGGMQVSVPSRVCHEKAWISYWICHSQGKLYAGVGDVPGKQCVAILEDDSNEAKQAADSGPNSEERKEGITSDGETKNEADDVAKDEQREEKEEVGEQQERSDAVENAKEDGGEKGDGDAPGKKPTAQLTYVGFGNSAQEDRQRPAPLRVRNIRLTGTTADLRAHLEGLSRSTLDVMVQVDANQQQQDPNTSGTDDDVMMTEAESQALLEKYQEECRKAKARAEKFGVPYKEPKPDAVLPWSKVRRLRANPQQGFITGLDLSDPAEKAKQEARRARFGLTEPTASTGDAKVKLELSEQQSDGAATTETKTVPVLQAWDNHDLVGEQRVDLPPSLWKNPPPSNGTDSGRDAFVADHDEDPVLVPEKIHIFSIDWAAFKQIRTNDVMGHFSIYGPSYVEWLGDLSCNVLFEDKFSAARALESMSSELPSPPPIADGASDTPPEQEQQQEGQEGDARADLGGMGWRMGKSLLRKMADDRYGRRGTTARLLMRVASSLDILKDRPSSWPKPPPGFSTKRVLGPGSDFPQRKRQQKKQKRGRDDRANGRPVSPPDDFQQQSGGEHPLLSAGLKSGRAGFSLEEMEAERARKRTKVEETDTAVKQAEGAAPVDGQDG